MLLRQKVEVQEVCLEEVPLKGEKMEFKRLRSAVRLKLEAVVVLLYNLNYRFVSRQYICCVYIRSYRTCRQMYHAPIALQSCITGMHEYELFLLALKKSLRVYMLYR